MEERERERERGGTEEVRIFNIELMLSQSTSRIYCVSLNNMLSRVRAVCLFKYILQQYMLYCKIPMLVNLHYFIHLQAVFSI